MIPAIVVKLASALGLLRFALAAAVFAPLERLVPHRARQRVLRDGWLTDLLSFVGNGVLSLAFLRVWSRAFPNGIGLLRRLPEPYTLHGKPVVVQAVAVLLASSFAYYWGHRALHAIPLLWRFHSVHHSIENMDWLATYRGHVFESLYFTAMIAVPTILFDLKAPAVLLFVVYRFFEGQIEHSNVRVPLGPLRWVVPSPWFHHWHHALDADAQNRNFSPYPIWDVVFGTAFMPAGRMPRAFGVDAPVPRDYPGQVLYPFGLRLRRVDASHALPVNSSVP